MQALTVFIAKHQELVYTFGFLLAALSLVEFIRLRRQQFGLNPQEAVQLMNKEHAIVLDIRDNDAFRSGHIIDALSMPKAKSQDVIKKLGKNRTKPLIITCYTGTSAESIASELRHAGFHTHILAGGMRAWSAANLPTVKE